MAVIIERLWEERVEGLGEEIHDTALLHDSDDHGTQANGAAGAASRSEIMVTEPDAVSARVLRRSSRGEARAEFNMSS